MEQLINLLIQKTYHHYKENYYQEIQQKLLFLKQEKLAQVFLASFHNSFVSFVGWEFNYNRFGSTLSRQLTYLDEIIIYQHDIKLNRHFLFSLYSPGMAGTAGPNTFNPMPPRRRQWRSWS